MGAVAMSRSDAVKRFHEGMTVRFCDVNGAPGAGNGRPGTHPSPYAQGRPVGVRPGMPNGR